MRIYMRFAIITIAAIFLSACNHSNNYNTSETNPETYIASDSAVLYYTDYHFNLDTLTVGEPKSVVFNYTNKGGAPLLVSNVFTSCGCVSKTWDKQPLMTGQSSTIKLDVKMESSGHFQKAIVVKNNSINEPTLTIRLEGYAVNKH
ncbi:MAG: DUF1573 domain-containing protein [Paludibacteraceae bacterium]|nr:DUF1573 domain-containing protein [Paludibacteraceae bacterium]